MIVSRSPTLNRSKWRFGATTDSGMSWAITAASLLFIVRVITL